MRACTQTKKVLLKASLHQCSITKLGKYGTYAILQKNLTKTLQCTESVGSVIKLTIAVGNLWAFGDVMGCPHH